MGPLILIGTTPLCQGGILSVALTVPIVAVWSQVCINQKFTISLYVAIFSLSQA